MSESTCWLCGRKRQLCESHIIPKFVFRWLIETGGTPYIRQGDTPNVRRQDGDKHGIYCGECENSLSKWENPAKIKFFIPATKREDISGPYGPWLSRFAASLAIRVLHSQKFRGICQKYEQEQHLALANAESKWRNFLLGKVSNPGANRLYVIYLGYFDQFDADGLPSNWNRWVHRCVERDTLSTESGSLLITYCKIGPLVFLGNVTDNNDTLMKDFLRCNQGVFSNTPLNVTRGLWDLFLDRARNAQQILGSISEKQSAKTQEEIRRNPDRFLDSDMAQRLMDDHRQFGPTKKNRP